MLDVISQLIAETHGFKHVQRIGDEILTGSGGEALSLADELFASDVYQARMCAVHIYGMLSATHDTAYEALTQKVVFDRDWRVQEMLAKAFDRYCADIGYEVAVPVIRAWLSSTNANQRRAASEGLRIWTSRPYFRDRPDEAITLLAALKADESRYVRTSVGNALRDISRAHQELVRAELRLWDTDDPTVLETHRSASRFIR